MPSRRIVGVLGAVAASMLVLAQPAWAAPGITVSRSTGLNPAGDKVTVSGTGFDVTKGIYVAVCVDKGPGQVPSPCLGGVDTSGAGGGSAWISSNPPPYGAGLAKPYGPGGSFSVTLSVASRDPVTGTDCTKVACAVVTRTDHTRAADRSQDARVRLTFGQPAPPPLPTTVSTPSAPPPPVTTTVSSVAVQNTASPETESRPDRTGWWIGAGAAVLLAAIAVLVIRARGNRRTD